MIRVFMGIPSMGERSDHQVYQLRDIEKRYAGEVELVYPERCCHRFGHEFARNEIVEEFLESDCDVLWFLDADVTPPVHILDLLTVHANKNWLAAGAPYPLFLPSHVTGDLAVAYTVYRGNAPDANGNTGLKYSDCPLSGTEWVDGLATGCLFLRRELFAKLEKPYFAFKRKPDTQECIEGEDLGFALKLQKLGIKYFVDHGMVCGHIKKVNLLDVQNYATALANAKLTAMHEQIRGELTVAIQEAAKKGAMQGYKQGREDALKGGSGVSSIHVVPAPRKTATGLILPG